MKTDKVYLVGFMGAGKSSIARALARRLDWRAVERQVLMDQIPTRHLVVATGGGTFVDPQNRAVIARDGLSVWLDVPIDRLIARVPADGRRPLAADRAEFERLYIARRAAYAHATYRVDAGHARIPAIVEELVHWLEA